MLLLIALCTTGIVLILAVLVGTVLRLQNEIAEMRRTWKPRNTGSFPLGWITPPEPAEHAVADDEDLETA
jgi:hypothetical protein